MFVLGGCRTRRLRQNEAERQPRNCCFRSPTWNHKTTPFSDILVAFFIRPEIMKLPISFLICDNDTGNRED
jgi:hypothetical protein